MLRKILGMKAKSLLVSLIAICLLGSAMLLAVGFNDIVEAQEKLTASDGGATPVLSPAPIPDDTLGDATVGVYYAIDSNNLLVIDKNTYAVSIVGPLGIANNFGGLAFDTSTGTLYAISGRSDASLYEINTGTGAATYIGTYSITDLFGLAYSPITDRLLGSQFISGGNLYSLDRATGAPTLIGSMGGPRIGSLAYHTRRQQLFGYQAGVGDLWTIDENTGLATQVGNDGVWTDNAGLAYNSEDDILLIADYQGNIYEIDPDTAVKTLVGTSGTNIAGLTFAPASVEKSCIEGKVKDEVTQTPIPFAFVLAIQLPSKDKFWDLTDQNGYYKIDCPAGLYLVIAIKKPYQPAWKIVNVPPGGCVTADFNLVP